MEKFKRFCFTLDLINDQRLIAEYKNHHEKIWPEITKSIRDSGIETLEIYCIFNRLFMIMEVNEMFSLQEKFKADSNNPKVQEWETLMWKYQQILPFAKAGEKWVLMEKIYQL